MTDLDLLHQYAEHGAHEAFEALVRRNVGWVSATAARITRDPTLGDDVTQAVFMLLSRKAGSLRKQMLLSNWLFTATRYCAHNAIREAIRRRKHERQAAAMRNEATPSSDSPSWEEVAPLIDGFVGKLHALDREAVLLRFYQRKTFAEVGSSLHISEEAARKRVSRGIAQLRTMFARKGVPVGATALVGLLSANLMIDGASASVIAAATSVTASATSASVTIMKGVGTMLLWQSAKPVIAFAVVVLVLGVTAATVLTSSSSPRLNGPSASAAPATTAAPAAENVYYGRVIAPDDKPVSGARVYLVSDGSWDRQTIGTATTDDDGRFRLPPGKDQAEVGRVVVQAGGYGFTAGQVSLDASENEPDEIQLKPETDAHIRFLDPDGKPAAGVHVVPAHIREKRGFIMATMPPELDEALTQTTDANGECAFKGMPRDGIIALKVLDERFAIGYANRDVPMQDNPITKDAVVKLSAAASISGRVVGEDGKPAAGVRVAAQGTNRNRNGGGSSDISDPQGNYRLKQLVPGEYNVAIDSRGNLTKRYTARALEQVTLQPGESLTGRDFKLITGVIVAGKVTVKGTGEPLPDMSIGVYGPAHPLSGAWVQTTNSGPDGGFQLRVPPGAQHVYLQSSPPPGFLGRAGQDARDVTVEDGATVVTNFELQRNPNPPVRGRVVDTNGRPVTRARVTIEPRSSDFPGAGACMVKTDAEGRFDIPGVANESRISAAKGRATTERQTVINASNRDLTLVIRVPKPASALVLVRKTDGKPVAGATVDLTQMTGNFGMGVESRKTGPDGTVTLKALDSNGRYHISVSADGFGVGQTPLDVQPGKQTQATVTLPKADSFIAGVVVDEDNKPLPDIEVVLNSGQSGHRTTRSDSEGGFRLDGIVSGDTPYVGIRDSDPANRPKAVPAGTTDAVITVKPSPARAAPQPATSPIAK